MKHRYQYMTVGVLILTALSITGLVTVEVLGGEEDETYVSEYTVQHEFADRSVNLNGIDFRVSNTLQIYFDTQSIEFRQSPYVLRDSARHVSQQVSSGQQPSVNTEQIARDIENSDVCTSYPHATESVTYPLTRTADTDTYTLNVSQETIHSDITHKLFSSSEFDSVYSQSSTGYVTTGTILVINSSAEQPTVTFYTTVLTCQ